MANHTTPQRSRAAPDRIVEALTDLTFEHRYDTISASDLILRARVGRSTFYERYRNKDEVLLAAMRPVLLALSTAASGRAARCYVRGIVAHLWHRRAVARSVLNSRAAPAIQRTLTMLIAAHPAYISEQTAARDLAAAGIAAAQLAGLQGWLAGRLPSSVDAMTDYLIGCSRLAGSAADPTD